MVSDQTRPHAKARDEVDAPQPELPQTSMQETARRAVMIERSGKMRAMEQAACRLGISGRSQRVLRVPPRDMGMAVQAMQNVGVSGTVMNIAGTESRPVGQRLAVDPVGPGEPGAA